MGRIANVGASSIRMKSIRSTRTAPHTVNTIPDRKATRPRALTKTLNTRQYQVPQLVIMSHRNSVRTLAETAHQLRRTIGSMVAWR